MEIDASSWNRYRCRIGNEWKTADQFSNVELKKMKDVKGNRKPYVMRCRAHTQGTVAEIRCVDCGVMKPAGDFSNANRKTTGSQRCRLCVDFTESDLAQTNPLPAPDGLRSVDEWNLSSRVEKPKEYVAKSMENVTLLEDCDTLSLASSIPTFVSRFGQYQESSMPPDRASTVCGLKGGNDGPDSQAHIRTQSVIARSDRFVTEPVKATNLEGATKRGGWAKGRGRKNELKVPEYLTGAKQVADNHRDGDQGTACRQSHAYDSEESPDEC